MNVISILRVLALKPVATSRKPGRQYAVTFTNAADLENLGRLLNHQAIAVMSGHPAPQGFKLHDLQLLSMMVPEQPAIVVDLADQINTLSRYIAHHLRLQRLEEARLHPSIDAQEMAKSLERLLAEIKEPMAILFKIG